MKVALPDARDASSAMMNAQLEADVVQRGCLKEASEQMWTCLKKDFAPLLPPLLPGLFNSLKTQEEASSDDHAHDNAYVTDSTGEGWFS